MLSSALAERLFELSYELICLVSRDGIVEDVNSRSASLLGFEPDEIRGRPWVSLVHPEDAEATLREARAAAGGAEVREFENRVLHRDGDARSLLWSAVPIPDEDRFLAIAKDVTDRRLREDELERTRRLLGEAEQIARVGSWEWEVGRPEGRFSPELRRMLGMAPYERARFDAHGRKVEPADLERVHLALRRLVATGNPVDLRVRVRHEDGSTAVLHHRAEAETDDRGSVVRIHGTVQDVSEQAEMTRRLRRMAEAALEISSAGSVQDALDATTRAARDVIGAHQVATSLLRAGTLPGEPASIWLSERYERWRDYAIAPDGSGIYRLVTDRQCSMRLTQAQLEAHPDFRGFGDQADAHPPLRGWLAAPLVAKDGATLGIVQLSDRFAGDFTGDDEQLLVQLAHIASTALERLDLEERFLQAQRVEAVGRLATGIIHDFNNTLAVMLVRSELLQATVSDADVAEHAAELHAAARAAADVASDLLALSRTGSATAAPTRQRPEPSDTCEVVREVARLAEPGLGSGVRLELDLPDDPLPTLVGKTDLHQALMNLVLNARDALEGSGTIRLGAEQSGDHVVVRVQDDGTGMDRDLQARIFTPYFTTKADRGGTGLGLAGVQTIVARAGGRIEVRSAPGFGSTFLLHLPHAERTTALVPSPASRALPGGDEPVAVVGRNRSVVAVVEALLDSLGYVVAPSRPGREPDMHGAALVVLEGLEPTGADRPDVPAGASVLHIIGPDAPLPIGAEGADVLRRPVSADELARTVRAILDRRRQRQSARESRTGTRRLGADVRTSALDG